MFPVTFPETADAGQAMHDYSISGDVERPQTYQFAADQSVYVTDLLFSSGRLEEPGYAVILRGSPVHSAGTEFVRPDMAGRGSLLLPGDIVVFRSESGFIPGRPNALVLFKDSRAELPLPEGHRSLTSLLEQCQLNPALQVPVTRTGPNPPETKFLDGSQDIHHGDVVDLSQVVQSSGLAVEQLFETVPLAITEQTGNSLLIPADAQINQSDAGAGAEEDALTRSLLAHAAPADQAAFDQAASDLSAAQNTDGRTGAAPFRNASFEQISAAQNAESSTARADQTAAGTSGDGAGSAVLNVIFVIGLLLAMGLILVGWLKTWQEREIENRMTETVRNKMKVRSRAAADTDRPADEDRAAVPATTPASQPLMADIETDVNDGGWILASGDHEITAGDPIDVALSTWFQDDGEAGVEAAASEAVFRETDAGTDSDLGTEISAAEAGQWIDDDRISAPFNNKASAPSGSGASAPEPPTSAGQDGLRNSQRTASAEESAVVDKSAAEEQAESSVQSSWQDLNDLLENRVTVEQKAADLPLRVNLYGRPSGPQCLRIDAAHSQVAPPHMAAGQRKAAPKRPAAAAAAGTEQTAGPGPSKATERTSASGVDFGRLDRALNFLEEHSDP
ncbi:MAG: hypothetical protein RIK87_13745 [Fuerstiella sp.]